MTGWPSDRMLDLPVDQLGLVKEILKRHLPNHRVIAFGSRVNGKARKYSDLDLCVMGNEPISLKTMAPLSYDLEESPLPIKVDVLDWSSLTPEFRRIIESQPTEIIQG